MQLMIAAAPELRQTACAARLPVANAAYRLEERLSVRPAHAPLIAGRRAAADRLGRRVA